MGGLWRKRRTSARASVISLTLALLGAFFDNNLVIGLGANKKNAPRL